MMPRIPMGASAVALATLACPAQAEARQGPVRFDIRPQPLGAALRQLGRQAHVQLVFDEGILGQRRAPAISDIMSVDAALARLLKGSGFGVTRTSQGVYVILRVPPAVPAPPRPAATHPPQTVQVTEIFVTGTRLIRSDLKAASPVTSAASREIVQQGAVNLEEVLNRFPQIMPDSQQLYQNSNGRQRLRLRGLDFNRTLVLIDGQRISDTEAVDINLIPVALVERIDVLTGGASSVYGSDGVAGVVNFVLKKNFDGIQVSGNTSFYQHDNRDNASTPLAQAYGIGTPRGSTVGGARIDLNATVGRNFLDERLNVTAFVGYRRSDPIFFGDRDISGCQIQRAGSGYGCLVTAASPNATITPLSGPFANQSFSNPTGTGGEFVDAASIAGYSNSKDREALRGFDRWNLGGFVRFKMAPSAEFYASILYERDLSRNSFYGPYVQSFNAYGTLPYQVNCDNPLMSAQQASILCGAAAGSATKAPLNVQIGFPGLGGNRSSDTFDNRNLRIAGGIRGEIAAGLRYDVSGVYARNRARWLTDGKPVFAKVNRALDVALVNEIPTCRAVVDGSDPGCVPLDIFAAGSGSAALRDYLFSEPRGISNSRTVFIDLTVNFTADLTRFGIASPLADQGLALVVGGEFRKTRQNNALNERYIDVYGGSSFSGSQNVREGNVEAQLPLVTKRRFFDLLQFNGGYRWSKYDINRRTFATWKIEGIWSPVSDVTLRAGINRAQRAPSIYEANQAIAFSTYNVNDFCAPALNPDGSRGSPRGSIQACRASGLPDALYGSPSLLCPDQMCRQRTGGFELSPEDARTLTAGVVLTPSFIPGLSLTTDYYRIHVNQVIGFNYADFAVNGCVATAAAYYCSRIVRNPDGTLFGSDSSNATGYIQAGTTNQYRLTAEGVDVSGEYTVPLGGRAGRLDFLFTGSRTIDSGGQDSVVTAKRNCVGYFGPRCGQPVPAWTHVARGTYISDRGVFSASVAWRFIGGTRTTLNSADPAFGYTAADRVSEFGRILNYSYFDLALSLAFGKGMVLTMSGNNLFDRMPPVLANSYVFALSRGNSVPQRYDVLGRQLSIGVTANF